MKLASSILGVLVVALLSGCGDKGGDTPDSITREILDTMKEMATIFEGITDEASAKAAIPKIEATRAKMRGIATRAKEVKTSSAQEEAVKTKYGKEQQEVMGALFKARAKLDTKPELLKIIEPALQGMENDM